MFPTVSPVDVEEVGRGSPRRHFADLAIALGGDHPGAGWLLAGQRRRLLRTGPPDGEAALLLARRRGRPVARLSAHCQVDGEGCFGFLAVAGAGETEAVSALLAAAAAWLAQRGAPTMIGPLSWTAADEAGVLVEGDDLPAVTGRAWTPAWYGDVLEAAGLAVVDEQCSYRLAAGPPGEPVGGPGLQPADLVVPADVGRFADPALLLTDPQGGGSVVAVPDLAGGRDEGEGRRGAWSLARQARRREWSGCVVTALDGPPEVLIPGLCAAAGRAGYQWVLSPWAPDDRPPVLRHRLYRGDVAARLSG